MVYVILIDLMSSRKV